MKTEMDLRKRLYEIDCIVRNTLNDTKEEKRELKKMLSEKEIVKILIRYAETNPSKEFVESQYNEAVRILSVINNRYKTWKQPNGKDFKSKSARKQYYLKGTDYKKQKEYIKTLGYFLGIN